MKKFLIILFLLLAIVLQTNLVSFLAISGTAPNLVLVLVLVFIIIKSFKEIWPAIVLAGLLLDSLSGLPFGLISLSLVSTAYLVDWFNKNVFSVIKFWITASLIIIGTLVYDLLLIGLGKIFQIDLFFDLRYLFIEILYNLLLVIIFFYGAKKIFHQE